MVTGIFCFMEARFQNWADIAGCDACRVLSGLEERAERRPDKAFTPHPAGNSQSYRRRPSFTAFSTTNLLFVAIVVQLPKIFFSLWK